MRSRKAAQELDGIDALPVQMAGVEGEAEFFAAVEGVEGHLGAVEVEGDLAGMDLEGEPDAALAADVEDRVPLLGELGQAIASIVCGVGPRIARHVGPERRAGEAAETPSPSFSAARQVAIISSAARCCTPAGSPSPQT